MFDISFNTFCFVGTDFKQSFTLKVSITVLVTSGAKFCTLSWAVYLSAKLAMLGDETAPSR